MAENKIAKLSGSEAKEALQRLQSKIKKTQEAAKTEGEALVRDLLTVGGGAGIGALEGYLKKTALDQGNDEEEAFKLGGAVDMDLAIGGVLGLAGIAKLGGKQSEAIRSLGMGVLSYAGGKYFRDMVMAEGE